MHFRNAVSTAFAIIIISLVSLSRAGNPEEKAATAPDEKMKWYTIEEAYALSKKEPRKIMVDLYTNWCGWCKKMDATTFSNPVITEYLSKKYYPVKFNAEIMDTIYFKEKAYPYVSAGNRSYNQLAYDLADGRLSYPTIVFIDEQANTIQAVGGYREAEEMDRILKYFGDNHYRTTDWQTFSNSYKSPFTQTVPGQ